jgi:uncharacterized protein (TIGR02646 family)
MRKISIIPPSDKKWTKWCIDCQKETEELHQKQVQGEKLSFKSELYSRSKEFFKEAFYGKCAYCECSIIINQHGDIEHFRPKARVTDFQDRHVDHPGYYWLAYDWRNLLLSCILCNQVSKENIGKGSRFPVIGAHAQTPEEIDTEQPLLINPASDRSEDDPAQHLDIDLGTGLLIPKSERGKTCIEVFGLNKREHLLRERKNALLHLESIILNLIKGSDEKIAESLAEMTEIRQGRRPFSLAQTTLLEKFYQNIDRSRGKKVP